MMTVLTFQNSLSMPAWELVSDSLPSSCALTSPAAKKQKVKTAEQKKFAEDERKRRAEVKAQEAAYKKAEAAAARKAAEIQRAQKAVDFPAEALSSAEALKAEGIESVVYHCPGGEPTTATAEAAIALASSNDCGSVIAIGGGTPVDTGKCVAAVLTNGGETPDLYDFLEVVGRARPLPCSAAERAWALASAVRSPRRCSR